MLPLRHVFAQNPDAGHGAAGKASPQVEEELGNALQETVARACLHHRAEDSMVLANSNRRNGSRSTGQAVVVVVVACTGSIVAVASGSSLGLALVGGVLAPLGMVEAVIITDPLHNLGLLGIRRATGLLEFLWEGRCGSGCQTERH